MLKASWEVAACRLAFFFCVSQKVIIISANYIKPPTAKLLYILNTKTRKWNIMGGLVQLRVDNSWAIATLEMLFLLFRFNRGDPGENNDFLCTIIDGGQSKCTWHARVPQPERPNKTFPLFARTHFRPRNARFSLDNCYQNTISLKCIHFFHSGKFRQFILGRGGYHIFSWWRGHGVMFIIVQQKTGNAVVNWREVMFFSRPI